MVEWLEDIASKLVVHPHATFISISVAVLFWCVLEKLIDG